MPSPATVIRAPTRSSFGASVSADSGMTRRVATIATTASATFSPNTARQDQNSSRRPDASSPRIALAPATPAQAPTAFSRCSRGKVLVMVDSVAGMTSAAPIPSTPRMAISQFGSVTVIAATDPAPKMPRPASSARRRP